MFDEITFLEDSICLQITNVPNDIFKNDIRDLTKSIIQSNNSASYKTKEILGFIKTKIFIFY